MSVPVLYCWWCRCLQDELIETLRSEGRRQAAHRMMRQKREGQVEATTEDYEDPPAGQQHSRGGGMLGGAQPQLSDQDVSAGGAGAATSAPVASMQVALAAAGIQLPGAAVNSLAAPGDHQQQQLQQQQQQLQQHEQGEPGAVLLELLPGMATGVGTVAGVVMGRSASQAAGGGGGEDVGGEDAAASMMLASDEYLLDT